MDILSQRGKVSWRREVAARVCGPPGAFAAPWSTSSAIAGDDIALKYWLR
jgi:hypothetical protein